MIAFLAGLLLVAVIVIGIISGDNEKFKTENEEMKGKISELKKILKRREYSFVSYKGLPLKVVKINNIFNDGTKIKGIPVMLEVGINTEGEKMLCMEFVKKHDTFFEILIGNEIRTFYVGNAGTDFLTLIEK
jgi:hypothetical protein